MLRPLLRFWRKAYDDNLTGMAAMVAYNLMLSVYPLALGALFVAGPILASDEIEASVVKDLQRLFPEAASSTVVDGLGRVRESSTTVGIVAVVAATWFSCTFWGALDTAFCRIYHRECRSSVRQPRVPLLGATEAVRARDAGGGPAVLRGEREHPRSPAPDRRRYGGPAPWASAMCAGSCTSCRSRAAWRSCSGSSAWSSGGVPRGHIPWRCVWPGALVAMGIVDYG
ncbi:MAG: YihY/virulence factor BrkB family protein, partial [Solirubrobacterales bacterium]|nr:YihY/virulence factor BrkB family protein [Solirubrobacterales bacterium]